MGKIGMIQVSVLWESSGELTGIAASETGLSQTLLELLCIDLTILHKAGSGVHSCVTLKKNKEPFWFAGQV